MMKIRTTKNDNEKHDGTNILLRLLVEVGCIFQHFHTIAIIKFLTSSKALLNFKGIPPDILDRVMLESFRANKHLKMFKLVKSSNSSLPISSGLSDDDDDDNNYLNKVLIATIPNEPYSLFDLKTGYQTINGIKCCFNIDITTNTTDIITNTTTDNTTDNNYDILRVVKSNPSDMTIIDHVVEVSIVSAAYRKILVQHNAIQCSDGVYKMQVSICNNCDKVKCEYCDDCCSCHKCDLTLCKDCNKEQGGIHKCSCCDKCDSCDYFSCCRQCKSLICSSCTVVSNCQTCDNVVCSKNIY